MLSNAEKFAHISIEQFTEQYIKEGRSARKTAKHFGMSPAAARERCKKLGLAAPHPRIQDRTRKQHALLDPAWEARQALAASLRPIDVPLSQNLFEFYTTRVLCRECFRFVCAISSNGEHSHLRKHFPDLSTNKERVDAYEKKHPGARLFSIAKSAEQSRRQGRDGDVRRFAEDFASAYASASELIEWRKDHEWEEHRGVDFVGCRECGLKLAPNTGVYLHIRLHGFYVESYRAKYPKAPLSSANLRERGRINSAKQRSRLLARSLPGDLKSQRELWRMIVPVLIADRAAGGNISNDEIRAMFGIKISQETMRRMRRYCGVRGPSHRPAKTV